MSFWSIIWNALTGNLTGIVSTITAYMGKLNDNQTVRLTAALGADKDVAIAQMQASAAAWHDRVDLMKGMRVTQWLIAAALIPPILHQGMIFLDSSFCNAVVHSCMTVGNWLGMPWKVPGAPPPYDEREWVMITSLLGIQGAVTVGLGAVKAVLRK